MCHLDTPSVDLLQRDQSDAQGCESGEQWEPSPLFSGTE